jgi:hypothetical protein
LNCPVGAIFKLPLASVHSSVYETNRSMTTVNHGATVKVAILVTIAVKLNRLTLKKLIRNLTHSAFARFDSCKLLPYRL